MKRTTLAKVRKEMNKANSRRPARMMPVPKEEWPKDNLYPDLKEVWLSNRYLAQVYVEGGGVLRVSCCRTTLNSNGIGWEENLTWDEMMQIKREICHSESYAVEVLPPDDDIVNVANMRHFWILPDHVVGWRAKEA